MGHYGKAVQKQYFSVLSTRSGMERHDTIFRLFQFDLQSFHSTLSLSKVFHFLIVYLWQQKQPSIRSHTDIHLKLS